MAGTILYVYTAESSFVSKDLQILSSRYRVIPFLFRISSKRSWPLLFLRQKLFLLRRIRGCEMVICQFAGMHAVLPVFFAGLFGKKSVVVAGGTDCVGFPSLRYGNFASPMNSRFTKYVYNNCDLILPVHEALVDAPYSYMKGDHPRQGIRYFMPGLKTPVRVVHNGYDSTLFAKGDTVRQEGTFVTVVAYHNARFTGQLKGLDLFTGLARKFPRCRFYIIGGGKHMPREQLDNLKYISNLSQAELVGQLAQFRFYVQLSISEGFPNGLSEAMLCECFPIVSAVGGMPDIVGDCGIVVPHRDQETVNTLVAAALQRTDLDEMGKRSRLRIATRYSLETRRKNLLDALSEL